MVKNSWNRFDVKLGNSWLLSAFFNFQTEMGTGKWIDLPIWFLHPFPNQVSHCEFGTTDCFSMCIVKHPSKRSKLLSFPQIPRRKSVNIHISLHVDRCFKNSPVISSRLTWKIHWIFDPDKLAWETTTVRNDFYDLTVWLLKDVVAKIKTCSRAKPLCARLPYLFYWKK